MAGPVRRRDHSSADLIAPQRDISTGLLQEPHGGSDIIDVHLVHIDRDPLALIHLAPSQHDHDALRADRHEHGARPGPVRRGLRGGAAVRVVVRKDLGRRGQQRTAADVVRRLLLGHCDERALGELLHRAHGPGDLVQAVADGVVVDGGESRRVQGHAGLAHDEGADVYIASGIDREDKYNRI